MENQYLDTTLDQPLYNTSNYAGFGRRFAAALIDGLLVGVVNNLLQSATGVSARLQEAVLEDPEDFASMISIAGPMWTVGVVIQLLYFAYFESSDKQATLGKQALGLIVTDTNGERISFAKAVIRFFGRWVSALVLLIGYIMQPFTQKKQALHDMIAGTLVLKK
ncbi:MAG: RDD family protein [Saprospiraceae bacterium]|nr:RDD family protein [Saprospiraceae bacterium]